jgi:hypothetical protein
MTITSETADQAEISRLRTELASEQRKSRSLCDELKKHRDLLLKNSLESEAEEEFLINNFNKKLERLTLEKERLALEVEREEELISNTLLKQLAQLRKDKIDLENQMEQEQECMVNKLQRQVATLDRQCSMLASQLSNERASLCSLLEELSSDIAPDAGAERLTAAREKLSRAHIRACQPVTPLAPLSPMASPGSPHGGGAFRL